jgi:DNA-binding NtrC family response regulator
MRILLVEDDDGLRAVARHVLEMEGHDVLPATGAEQALALDAEHGEGIEVVVTDNAMPGIWGIELLEQLGAARRGLGVVVISGYPSEGDDGQLVWLQKPFTTEELAAAVRTASARAGRRYSDGGDRACGGRGS